MRSAAPTGWRCRLKCCLLAWILAAVLPGAVDEASASRLYTQVRARDWSAARGTVPRRQPPQFRTLGDRERGSSLRRSLQNGYDTDLDARRSPMGDPAGQANQPDWPHRTGRRDGPSGNIDGRALTSSIGRPAVAPGALMSFNEWVIRMAAERTAWHAQRRACCRSPASPARQDSFRYRQEPSGRSSMCRERARIAGSSAGNRRRSIRRQQCKEYGSSVVSTIT